MLITFFNVDRWTPHRIGLLLKVTFLVPANYAFKGLNSKYNYHVSKDTCFKLAIDAFTATVVIAGFISAGDTLTLYFLSCIIALMF